MKHTDPEYRNPTPVVDVILEHPENKNHVLLIKRKNEPYGLALPGGFVDEGESAFDAAVRESKEELGLTHGFDMILSEQFFTYSSPDRDPRQHTMSTVFVGQCFLFDVTAGDDAEAALYVNLNDYFARRLGDEKSLFSLPPAEQLVFDHAQILSDYVKYKLFGERPPTDR